jgi:hypothetical protein
MILGFKSSLKIPDKKLEKHKNKDQPMEYFGHSIGVGHT